MIKINFLKEKVSAVFAFRISRYRQKKTVTLFLKPHSRHPTTKNHLYRPTTRAKATRKNNQPPTDRN